LLSDEGDEDGAPVQSSVRPVMTSVVGPTEPITILELIKRKELRRPVAIVALAMISQQGSGINAVIYYSTNILGKALPTNAAYISLLISVVNVVMTFAPVILIGRYTPRTLLLASIVGGLTSSTVLGFALNANIIWLSSTAIVFFVSAFALGLGPIPFMLPSELVPYYASSPLASFGLSLNWMSNFLVGIAFLPLKNWLAGWSPSGHEDTERGQGNVFFVFPVILLLTGTQISRLYRK